MGSFKEKMALGDQMEMTGEYAAFVEKFKSKKTTDDCYTPDNVYAAVLDWAVKEYGLEGARIIRPFYPGGDYTKEDYSGDCAVIDNPPFSILAEICRWYSQRGIRYFYQRKRRQRKRRQRKRGQRYGSFWRGKRK